MRGNREERIDACSTGQDTWDTLQEAFNNLEAEFNRSVSRLLFPGIERLLCLKYKNDRISRNVDSRQIFQDHLNHQGDLSVLARNYPYGFCLFGRLVHHLYASIESEAGQKYYMHGPVPNPHATLHGYISYDSHQSSLNILIITVYVIQLVPSSINPANT